jgi:hypothetical protein
MLRHYNVRECGCGAAVVITRDEDGNIEQADIKGNILCDDCFFEQNDAWSYEDEDVD